MRLHHAGISVPDLERSLDWYCRALNLTEGHRFEVPPFGLRGVFALDPAGAGVELLEMAGALPGVNRADPPSANSVHGYNHMCFEVTNLEAAYERALIHGAVPVWDPRPAPEPGVRMAYVTDLDGNLIELIHRVEG
jgi:lactoylglutathione lyase